MSKKAGDKVECPQCGLKYKISPVGDLHIATCPGPRKEKGETGDEALARIKGEFGTMTVRFPNEGRVQHPTIQHAMVSTTFMGRPVMGVALFPMETSIELFPMHKPWKMGRHSLGIPNDAKTIRAVARMLNAYAKTLGKNKETVERTGEPEPVPEVAV
jgi:hypothetical protein